MTSDACTFDVIVIGGGIAGLSLAAELAADRRVAVLEKERALGRHTTGRSVATFIQSYGNDAIQALNAASLPLFETGSTDAGVPFARPLPFLYAASADTVGVLDAIAGAAGEHAAEMQFVDGDVAAKLCPVLRPGWVERALVDPSVKDIDVGALVQHHAARIRAAGGAIEMGIEIVAGRGHASGWELTDAAGNDYRAGVVVNAANAWADTVAGRLGADPLGVTPLKRSVFTLAVPESVAGREIPMVNAADEEFYFKPDSGQLLCSPADETPTAVDARGAEQPDEYEIARALDGLERATILDARHVRASWGGLRCFAPDRTPLVGWDPAATNLFWHTAVGGYGIQTSPALSRLGASILRGEPGDEFGSDVIGALDPARTMRTVARH